MHAHRYRQIMDERKNETVPQAPSLQNFTKEDKEEKDTL